MYLKPVLHVFSILCTHFVIAFQERTMEAIDRCESEVFFLFG